MTILSNEKEAVELRLERQQQTTRVNKLNTIKNLRKKYKDKKNYAIIEINTPEVYDKIKRLDN